MKFKKIVLLSLCLSQTLLSSTLVENEDHLGQRPGALQAIQALELACKGDFLSTQDVLLVSGLGVEQRLLVYQHFLETYSTQGWALYGRTYHTPPQAHVVIEDPLEAGALREKINFASSNFLSLAQEKFMAKAAYEAILQLGSGPTTSALFATTSLHATVEARLAEFVSKPASALFKSGSAANQAWIHTFAREGDALLFDMAASHSSVYDGNALALTGASGERVKLYSSGYKFNSPSSLERQLSKLRGESPPEGFGGGDIFVNITAMTGVGNRVADIAALAQVAKKFERVFLIVDESHSIGVIGPRGRGAASIAEAYKEVFLIVGSLSKAFATESGFVAGNKDAVGMMRMSRPYVFTGGPSTAPTAQTLEVLRKLEGNFGVKRLKLLRDKLAYVKERLVKHHIPFESDPQVPLITFRPGKGVNYREWQKILHASGLLINLFEAPAVKNNEGVLRASIMSDHSYEDLDRLVEVLSSTRSYFEPL